MNGEKWCEIFATGTHKGRSYTTADLDTIVRNFRPAEREVPVVVGHPKNEDPAWGWVNRLRRTGAKLEALYRDVDPAFAKLVKAGRYRTRSVKLRGLKSGNPSLVHVGFLGAAPPAVEGLKPYQFSEEEQPDDVDVVEFNDATTGEDMSDITLTPEELQAKIDAAVAAQKAKDQEQFDALTVELANERNNRRLSEAAAVIAGLSEAGKLPPALATGLAEFAASLDDEDEVEFSADGDAKTKATRAQFFMDWLGRFEDSAIFSSVAGKDSDPKKDDDGDVAQFDGAGMNVSEESIAWRNRAHSYAKKHQVSLDAAFKATRNG